MNKKIIIIINLNLIYLTIMMNQIISFLFKIIFSIYKKIKIIEIYYKKNIKILMNILIIIIKLNNL